MSAHWVVSALVVASVAFVGRTEDAAAQDKSPSAKPWGRVSFFSTTAQSDSGGVSRGFGEFASSITFQLPDQETDGLDYGLDIRHSGYSGGSRLQRLSIYEGFVGARFGGATMRARVGHLWLNDLGALGSIAGGLLEYRQPAEQHSPLGRFRFGAFAGFEPRIFDTGYAPNVRKLGGYVAIDGAGVRRHVIGFVTVRDGGLTERSVVAATNFLPLGPKVFVYQAAEYDVTAPAGLGHRGLAYLFTNARITASSRVELQATYSRGRSVDTRGLSDDVLSGRPLTQASIEGLLYESIGGRVTVEVAPRVHVYSGYSRDANNRDDAPTGRALFGGFASNVMGSGFDLTASDSITDSPTGGLSSQYFSIGRQIGRAVYVYGDYSTSLSVLHFSRSDGVVIESRPHTRRVSGTATINLPAMMALMLTVDRTTDGASSDLRVLAGITYRFK